MKLILYNKPAFQFLSLHGFKFLVILFFVVLFFVGLKVFPDYGVHLDEENNQAFGQRSYEYIRDFNILSPAISDSKFDFHDKIHGPIFQIILIFIKNQFNLTDSRTILLMRHLCTFLIFYLGVVFFYLLNYFYFKERKIALLGCLFLVLHPRIFAHSFYNSADIPFLSFYIISTYTLLRFLEQRNRFQLFI